MALKQIKNKIVSTQKTGKVTKAMEAVSAVKMRKTQERALASRPYVHTAMRVLARIAETREVKEHRLAAARAEGKTLLVIVTSDKGLAGGVNSAVLKQAERILRTSPDADLVVVGRKALDFANRNGREVLGAYTNISDDVTVSHVYEMADVLLSAYETGAYKEAFVVYQNFVSTFEQRPVVRKLLPLARPDLEEIARDIRPKTGRYSEDAAEVRASTVAYTIEPSAEGVLDTLIPQMVKIVLFHALVENKASEHSARMVAMKGATDKTKEIVRALTLVFNKERQAAITAEVSEITGGIEALKN